MLTDSRLRDYVQLAESWSDRTVGEDALNAARQTITERSASAAVPEDLLRLVGGLIFESPHEQEFRGPHIWAVDQARVIAQAVIQRSANEEAQKGRLSDFLRCLFP